jgi:hypothetical protein
MKVFNSQKINRLMILIINKFRNLLIKIKIKDFNNHPAVDLLKIILRLIQFKLVIIEVVLMQ